MQLVSKLPPLVRSSLFVLPLLTCPRKTKATPKRLLLRSTQKSASEAEKATLWQAQLKDVQRCSKTPELATRKDNRPRTT